MSARGLNLLVFRDGRRRVSGAQLKLALMTQLESLSGASTSDARIGALLRAGELECAVADSTCDGALPFAELTDALAELLVGGQLPNDFQDIKEAAAHAAVPEQMTVSAPEGFAYYA